MATRNIVYEDSGDEGVSVDPPALALPSPAPLPKPDPSFPAPAHYDDLAEEVATFVASLALPWDHNWQTLNSAPFQVVARGPLLTSIVFADGRSRVMDTAAVDTYLRVTTQTPTPPLPAFAAASATAVSRASGHEAPIAPTISLALAGPQPRVHLATLVATRAPAHSIPRTGIPAHTTPVLLTPSGHHVPASCPRGRTAIVTAIVVRPRPRPYGAMAPGPS